MFVYGVRTPLRNEPSIGMGGSGCPGSPHCEPHLQTRAWSEPRQQPRPPFGSDRSRRRFPDTTQGWPRGPHIAFAALSCLYWGQHRTNTRFHTALVPIVWCHAYIKPRPISNLTAELHPRLDGDRVPPNFSRRDESRRRPQCRRRGFIILTYLQKNARKGGRRIVMPACIGPRCVPSRVMPFSIQAREIGNVQRGPKKN